MVHVYCIVHEMELGQTLDEPSEIIFITITSTSMHAYTAKHIFETACT